MATRVSSPVLLGRVAELSALIAAWDAAVAGRPSTVLVGGEAGIGKSRLVAELTRHVWPTEPAGAEEVQAPPRAIWPATAETAA